MAKVNAEEIQRNLLEYLQRVQAGETVIILRDGKPVAEMKPTPREPAIQRPFGLCAGEFTVPDDFDAPLPDHLLADFEGR